MTNLWKSENGIPEYRMDSPNWNSKLTFVDSFFPRVGQNYHLNYHHNGSCYQKVQAGHYLLHICYTIPEERKYMVRIIGQGVTLKLL